MAFAQAFPHVDAWWFGSVSTQQVRISRPVQSSGDGRSVTGRMQFVDDATTGSYWMITQDTPVTVDVPYPPNEVQLINLPLWRTEPSRRDLWSIDSEASAGSYRG